LNRYFQSAGESVASRQKRQDTGYFIGLGDFSQPYIGDVRERHHHGHAAVKETKKIEPLELSAKNAGTDILNGPNALVRVNHFFTDHEGHTEISPNTGA
jgi:hypothetical protein